MIRGLRPGCLAQRILCSSKTAARRTYHRKMPVKDKISPTDREKQLFKVLTGTLDHAGLSTTLRCAGGWVRDKLLGLESDDIDIAIDNMMGREFAEHVNTYLESQNLKLQKVAVIMSNPEQSKHLETARMRVNGLELDLVNLRSETYADSRIPQMTFGTATQDAKRRDFTINSLFYNLNSSEVEDFTGQGIDDLKAGIIRTPLPPRQTFLDDPLRVLRALRFAARFDFELEATLQAAAAVAEVRKALAEKVSRERMGIELEKMFTGPGPVRAMRDMNSLNLFPAVFAVPPEVMKKVGTSYGDQGVSLMEAADQLLHDWQPQGDAFSKDERRLALMAALLLPLRAATAPVVKKKAQPLTTHILSHSIKWRSSDAACIEVVHRECGCLLEAFQQLQGTAASPAPKSLRVLLGSSLRNLKGPSWRIGILLAPVVGMQQAALLGLDAAEAETMQPQASSSPSTHDMSLRESRVECCKQLEAAVTAMELEQCWNWKPLLDGKEIMSLLGIKGPQVGKLTAKLTNYQLEHPRATPDEARAFLQQANDGG